MKNTLLLICLFLLGGCEYRKETKQYGVFEQTMYFRKVLLDWEGGNEGVYKTTLCNRKTSECWEDEKISFTLPGIGQEQWKLRPDQPWILLFNNSSPQEIRYVNALTGEEIQCTNCGKEAAVRLDHENGELLRSYWFHGAKRLLIESGPSDQSKVRFDYLEFQGDHVEFHPIVEYATQDKPKIHLRLSTMDFMAWMFCGTKCTASTFDFKKRQLRQDVAVCKSGETIWVEKLVPRCVSSAEFYNRHRAFLTSAN